MKTNTAAFLKKRKFLMVLPLLALPFVTMAFWALGGGSGTNQPAAARQKGLNLELPGAQPSTEAMDKMSLYKQADKDSLALREQQKMDPYAIQGPGPDTNSPSYQDMFYGQSTAPDQYTAKGFYDPNEARVKNKLAQLNQALNQPQYEPQGYPSDYNSGYTGYPGQASENLRQAMPQPTEKDPEMEQLNGLMEKLLDLQNPARAQEKLKELSIKNRGRVFPVTRYEAQTGVDLLTAEEAKVKSLQSQENAFYELGSGVSVPDTLEQTAIPAVVHETQVLVSGATLKLRLTEDIFINGALIVAGTFVSGNCSIDGERLKVNITNIRSGKNLYPVSLSIYDLDAIEGIRVPGAISRDAAKEGADRTLQSVQLMSLDPSIGAQAAGAGVEVAKGFLGKKAKLIRVMVKAGHPLLLMDAKTKQGF